MNATERLILAAETALPLVHPNHYHELAEAIAAAKEEQRRSPTWLGHCSGCKSPHSEGTHQMGTIEHPDIDNAKGNHATGSSAVIGNVRERWKELGYDKPERVEERFRNDPWRLFYSGWVEGRLPLITGSDKYWPAKGSGLTVEGTMEAHDRLCDPLRRSQGERFRKALEDLAGKGSDPWISVEDRLPEPEEAVLWCCVPIHEPYTVASMLDDDFDYDLHDGSVTHWMPLPAPPDNTTP